MLGIFDSGVGGLTVVKEIFKELPKYQIIYFGDTARLPYGTKGAGFVRRYSLEITDYLVKKGAKIIIIACHTSSSWAADFLKNRFSLPILEVITPAIKESIRATKNKKIGIIGTPGTIRSDKWRKKLLKADSSLKVYLKSCPLFVPLVEEGWIHKKITRDVVKEYLEPLRRKKIDTLILACTHYPLLEKEIRNVMGNKVKIINPAKSLAKELKLFLKENPEISSKIKKGKKHQFFFSDQPYNFKKISRICFGKEVKAIINDPFYGKIIQK